MNSATFKDLKNIFIKPEVFKHSNSTDLWNNSHISKEMLKFHLNPDVDPASRNKHFIDRSVKWFSKKFKISSKTEILDLGCGPGLYSRAFAESGAIVTGIDVSQNSIEYAIRQKAKDNLNIFYINDNYLDCDFMEEYDLITLIYDDYCVLNENDRKILLKKIHKALKVNGSFVLDVLSTFHFENVQEKQSCIHSPSSGFWSPDEHIVFENIYKYKNERVILEKNTIIEENNIFTICNYLKCFDLDEIIQELSENGFKTTETFSDIAGTELHQYSKEYALINIKM